MNLYSTSLSFCFVQGILYSILFFVRSYKNDRLSDLILGLILIGCCLEIMDYMLGFMGINILWEELEFFPRNINLLIGPFCYFYLLSQTNHDFKLKRNHFLHALPFIILTAYHLIIFCRAHYYVLDWEATINNKIHFTLIEKAAYLISNYVYLYFSLKLFKDYSNWAPSQFSDIDSINYKWFRNFIIALTVSITINWTMEFMNSYFDFSFYQNWWGKLATGILIYYISIEGFTQKQDKRIPFNPEVSAKDEDIRIILDEPSESCDLAAWRYKLNDVMLSKKLYLKQEYSLTDLAAELNTNCSSLSYIINNSTGKNFNDFINEFRVHEFEGKILLGDYKHLSVTGIAYDCGFNSKATFYRAFKKIKGTSPAALISKSDNETSQSIEKKLQINSHTVTEVINSAGKVGSL